MNTNKISAGKSKTSLGNLINNSGSVGAQTKLPALVPPVLREVSKLAAGVASVSTTGSLGGNGGAACSSGSATGNPRNKCALQPGHSLMDWIRLGSSGKDLTGVGPKAGHLAVTEKELEKHNHEKDVWLAIRGKVFNVTPYLLFHPGGCAELMKGAGKDATTLFDQVHPWVNYEQILQKCYIGRLVAMDPSVDKEALFLGLKVSTSPQLVQSPTTSNNNVNPVIVSPTSENILLTENSSTLPRFDWIQKIDFITIIFYTKAFSNPLLEIFKPTKDNGILIVITYETTIFHNEIVFHEEVLWPCQQKFFYETGKVEMVFRKTAGMIWNNYGVLKQTCKPAGEVLGNVKHSYVIDEKVQVNHNTMLFRMERNDGSKLVVPIGKHVRVFGTIEGVEMARSYTPVPESTFRNFSPNNQSTDSICLMIKRYPNGNISRFLFDKRKGDLIYITKPMGDFSLKNLEKREIFLLLSAGTGITPMLSLIIFLLERRMKKCQFIQFMFFNKTENDILCRSKLDQLGKEDSRFHIDYILSEAGDSWTGLRGHITKLMIENSLQKHMKNTGYTIRDLYCCVCGPNPFTVLSQQLLKDIGVTDKQIHSFQG